MHFKLSLPVQLRSRCGHGSMTCADGLVVLVVVYVTAVVVLVEVVLARG